MKGVAIILLMGLCYTALLYGDTFVYKVAQKKNIKTLVEFNARDKGNNDTSQPFNGTHILQATNTDYFLITVSPKDGNDPKLEAIDGVTLHKIWRLDEDGFIRTIYTEPGDDTDFRWDVKRSSK